VHDVYYPGTEALAPDEMRVIACGTGMPTPCLKQAAGCLKKRGQIYFLY
jgi:ribonuclease Z